MNSSCNLRVTAHIQGLKRVSRQMVLRTDDKLQKLIKTNGVHIASLRTVEKGLGLNDTQYQHIRPDETNNVVGLVR